MEKKLSVVQVIDQLQPGGAERVLITLSNILYRNGHKVTVITTVKPGSLIPELDKGISYLCLYRKWKYNPFTMRKLVQEIKDEDIIHVHSMHNLRYVWLAMQLYRVRKKIFYQEHHGARANEKPGWLLKKMMRQNIFIGVSADLKVMAQQKLQMRECYTFVLPNIIEKKRQTIFIATTASVINLLLVSNFVRVKNIEFAVEIFEQFLKHQKDARLTIIGHTNDKGYYNEILQLVHQKQLSSFINILYDVDNIQPLLNQYHLAIHTSRYESGPLVLLEYMAQQLPFISYLTGEVAKQASAVLPECFMPHFDTSKWMQRLLAFLETDIKDVKNRMANYFNTACSSEQYYKECIKIYTSGLKE